MKSRSDIIFTYFLATFTTQKRQFPGAFCCHSYKICQKKKAKKKNAGGGRNPKVDPAPCSVNTTHILTLGLLHKWGPKDSYLIKKTQFW